VAWAAPPDSAASEQFENKIRPVLATRCYGCHSSQAPKPQGGLLLDSAAGIRQGGNSGPVIDTAEPDKSTLLRAISYKDKALQMPPGKALAPEIVADFEAWIRAGAPLPADSVVATAKPKSKDFWSFRQPEKHAPPSVKNTAWPQSDIDRFILAKLEQRGIQPSPRADKRTLIRRATYDLTGLPPTAKEIEAFEADNSADAREQK